MWNPKLRFWRSDPGGGGHRDNLAVFPSKLNTVRSEPDNRTGCAEIWSRINKGLTIFFLCGLIQQFDHFLLSFVCFLSTCYSHCVEILRQTCVFIFISIYSWMTGTRSRCVTCLFLSCITVYPVTHYTLSHCRLDWRTCYLYLFSHLVRWAQGLVTRLYRHTSLLSHIIGWPQGLVTVPQTEASTIFRSICKH